MAAIGPPRLFDNSSSKTTRLGIDEIQPSPSTEDETSVCSAASAPLLFKRALTTGQTLAPEILAGARYTEGVREPEKSDAPVIFSLLTITFAGIGALPVLMRQGAVSVDVLRWIKEEKVRHKKSQTTLYRYALSLRLLSDYCTANSFAMDGVELLSAYFEALVHGFALLMWKPVSRRTAKDNIESVNRFMDWYSYVYNVTNPNPKVDIKLNWFESMRERERQQSYRLLSHLFSATKSSESRSSRAFPVTKLGRGNPISIAAPKGFNIDDYLLLLKHETSPREKMAWLLLGAGGLRLCEILNLFASDIHFDAEYDECDVFLTDPISGPVKSNEGRTLQTTRKTYLEHCFNLVPREEISRANVRFVGWKGMRFHESDSAGVVWLHPALGRLAWHTHLSYLNQRGTVYTNEHPWYFVNISRKQGEVLCAGTLKQIFEARCRSLGLPKPHNLHSLRHMYVTFLVQALGIPLPQAQYMVRHCSTMSTSRYVGPGKEATRRALESAIQKTNIFNGLLDENMFG